jgi:hypothetical protein
MSRFLGMCVALTGLACVLAQAGAGQDEPKKGLVDVEAFFTKLDANKDGKLNKDEFLKLADRAKEKDKAREKLGQVFDKIDPRNKGLTKDQFKKFLEMKKTNEK